MVYNIMTCQGGSWTGATGFAGGCSMSWMVAAILVFVVLISKKQIGENLGVTYNIITAFVGAFLPWLIVTSIFGNFKIALVVGLIGSFAGGFIGGALWDLE